MNYTTSITPNYLIPRRKSSMEKSQDYERFNSTVKEIVSVQTDSWRYVEKLQYAIASGALALSITLLTLVQDDITYCKNLLVWSWILLTSSIIINFISHLVSYCCSEHIIRRIYKKMSNKEEFRYKDVDKLISKGNIPIFIMNILSIISLIVGVILVLRFYIAQI